MAVCACEHLAELAHSSKAVVFWPGIRASARLFHSHGTDTRSGTSTVLIESRSSKRLRTESTSSMKFYRQLVTSAKRDSLIVMQHKAKPSCNFANACGRRSVSVPTNSKPIGISRFAQRTRLKWHRPLPSLKGLYKSWKTGNWTIKDSNRHPNPSHHMRQP